MPVMQDELLNLSAAAKLLGVKPGTLRGWANRNEIPCVRLPSGHRRFRRSDVEAIFAGDTEVAS